MSSQQNNAASWAVTGEVGETASLEVWDETVFPSEPETESIYDPARHRLRMSLGNVVPITVYHLGALTVFFVGFSLPAALGAFVAYWTMVFGVSAGYHRLLSHRSYETHRWFQFLIAFAGAMSAQMGPLWWSAHHRQHHRYSEKPKDVHSPVVWGFWWSHIGWIFDVAHERADLGFVPDLARFPELAWLDRFRYVPPLCLAASMYGVGTLLEAVRPEWGTSGLQMLVWGFFLCTTVMYHVTFSVNSVAHLRGARPFDTGDNSRNNVWLALVTNGDGWHNNHHRSPASARHGIHWWQLDMTYYFLRALEKLGIVWNLRTHPRAVLEEARRRT